MRHSAVASVPLCCQSVAVTGATGLYKVASSPAPDAKSGEQEGQPELAGASETLEEIEARAEELRVLGKRAKEKWLALARTKDWEQVKSRLEVYKYSAEEVEKIFKVIQSQVDNTHRKFEVGARNLDKKEFKW